MVGYKAERMGRGVSAGGGQSSLGYLFGGEEAPAPQPPPKDPTSEPSKKTMDPTSEPSAKTSPDPNIKQTPPSAGYTTNNYYRTDGQNCGNFITVSCYFATQTEKYRLLEVEN